MTAERQAHHRKRLLALEKEIQADLADSKDASGVVELDTAIGRLSRMDEIQNQAMSAETERRRLDELHRIDAALARMAEDEYGYCATCGDEIEKKRLELDPAILTCIGCAR